MCRSERCVGPTCNVHPEQQVHPSELMLNAFSMSLLLMKLYEKGLNHWVCFVIRLIDLSAIKLFYVARSLMGLAHIFMFVLDEELDSPAYPDDFQDVEVKDEPFEYDAVSCDLFYYINLMLILMYV